MWYNKGITWKTKCRNTFSTEHYGKAPCSGRRNGPSVEWQHGKHYRNREYRGNNSNELGKITNERLQILDQALPRGWFWVCHHTGFGFSRCHRLIAKMCFLAIVYRQAWQTTINLLQYTNHQHTHEGKQMSYKFENTVGGKLFAKLQQATADCIEYKGKSLAEWGSWTACGNGNCRS